MKLLLLLVQLRHISTEVEEEGEDKTEIYYIQTAKTSLLLLRFFPEARSHTPTNIGITRCITIGGDILVVVSDGADIWVALRFTYHLYSVRNARAGIRIVKKKLWATHH